MRLFCGGDTRQNRLVELVELSARDHARHRQSDLAADVLRHPFVVAGDHLDVNVAAPQCTQRQRSAGLGRIDECGEPAQHELGLVVDHRVRVVR